MLFNKKQIESSIHFDEKTWLYCVKLPWIKRHFEQVLYNFQGTQKLYNIDEKNIERWIQLNNTLLWITRIFNYYVICFLSLDTLKSRYYFVETFHLSSFKLSRDDKNIFVYKNYNWEVSYKIDSLPREFSSSLVGNDCIVKNDIFNTELFKIDISKIQNFELKKIKKSQNNQKNIYQDIADFYIYDDFFIKNNSKVYDDFLQFFLSEFSSIYSSEYQYVVKKYDVGFYPLLKINLKIIQWKNVDFSCSDFRKLLFCFFSESIVWNYTDQNKISEYFSENIIDISDMEIKKLTSKIQLPKNIFLADESFHNIRVDILKLRHNLFILKENHQMITEFKKINSENESVQLSVIKGQIKNENLEKTIIVYEWYLKKYLDDLVI